MNATTITEEDIKALQKSQSKAVRLTQLIVFLFGVVVFVACGVMKLYMCSRWAHSAGMSMNEVVRSWFSNIDPSQTYAGVYLKALERWVTGITELTAAGFFVFIFVVARKVAKRNTRILRFIEDKGI